MEFVIQPLEVGMGMVLNDQVTNKGCTVNTVEQCGCIINSVPQCGCTPDD